MPVDTVTAYQQGVEGSTTVTNDLTGYLLMTFLICGGVFVLFGNAITIIVIVTTPAMNNQLNVYILNLAIADSIIGFAMIQISFRYGGFSKTAFDQNKYLCLSGYVLAIVSGFQSLLTLSIMALDRLICVQRPFLYVRVFTERLTTRMVVCSWAISIGYGVFPFYHNDFSPAVGCDSFKVLYPLSTQIMIPVPALFFMIVTSACYLRIAFIARKQRRRIAAEMIVVQCQGQANNTLNSPNQRKSTKLFLTMNCLFVVCWMPFLIICFLAETSAAEKVGDVLTLVAMSNSGMNFVIYALKNKQFSRAYRRILKRCCCRRCER